MADRPQPRDWDEDPHSPLTEDEWLAEFQRMDAQAARYGDLFETLIDDPNRDELIDREMGWDDDLTEDELAELDAECIEIIEDETIAEESDGVLAEVDQRSAAEPVQRGPSLQGGWRFSDFILSLAP